MTGWGAYALTILATLVLLILCWSVADRRKARRRARFIARHKPDWSVSAIPERVEQERPEEDAAKAPTELLPAIRPKPDQPPTGPRQASTWPNRSRRYVRRLS